MKKTALRYGLITAGFLVGFFFLGLAIYGKSDDFTGREVVGYSTMIVSMIFVYFGIKHFRDHVNGGALSFGKGMKMGLLIVLVPAIAFGIFTIIYVTWIDPEHMSRYYEYELSQLKASLSSTEFEAASVKMKEEMEMFSSPVMSFFVMALTVYLIGVIATVISSLILRRAK